MIKKILSYAFPLKQKKFHSNINPGLELRWENGTLVLNSHKANYSFGNLHRVFDKAFYTLDLKTSKAESLLLLGMGAGSVISLLRNKYLPNCRITAVELDPQVIDIAKTYFGIEGNELLTIHCADAEEFVANQKSTLHIIIADVFIDTQVPEGFTGEAFYKNIYSLLPKGGMFIQNLMPKDKTQIETATAKAAIFFKDVFVLSPMAENKVMVCRKE